MTNGDPSASPKNTPRPARKRRRRAARGILWVIAASFAFSGFLRLGDVSGIAIAAGGLTPASEPAESTEGCAPLPDIAVVLEALAVREARVKVREEAMIDRMQALSVAETQVARNLEALEAAEISLEGTIALAATAAEDDIAQLTTVYENMKPKEAAPLFAAMDPQFAAGFLGRMRPAAAAAILSGLAPENAYSISVILAGRNAEVPTQ